MVRAIGEKAMNRHTTPKTSQDRGAEPREPDESEVDDRKVLAALDARVAAAGSGANTAARVDRRGPAADEGFRLRRASTGQHGQRAQAVQRRWRLPE